ncbi:unnamed protein product [Caenorhabditis nigoni]
MTSKVITHKSGQKTVSNTGGATVLEIGEKDGIKYSWSGHVDTSYRAILTWKIDWEDLKNEEVDRLVGQLVINSIDGDWVPHTHTVNIDWTEPNQSTSITLGGGYSSYNVSFEYSLTAHYAEVQENSYDEMFAASDMTDMILIVEGKKLNVNKTFLSLHSDYFSTLFSANFKEGQMKEIEIKEVFYEDFGLLCSSFYPNQQFPNDQTVEKLLEMASRFQVSSVVRIVEYHLLNNSKIGYEKLLWLADEYVMPKLLKKCVSQMNSAEKAKNLKKSPEFEKLPDKTKAMILARILRFI